MELSYLKATLIFMLCVSISSDSTKLEADVTDFAKLYENSIRVTQKQLNNGIKVNRCAANKSEHDQAASKICIQETLFHCLSFQGNCLVICKEPAGLYPPDTYPVIDNVTKNFDACPCPTGKYQPDYYYSNTYGISCGDKPTSETELTTEVIVSETVFTKNMLSNKPNTNNSVPSTDSSLNGGEIAIIITGIVLVLGIVTVAIALYKRCFQGRQRKAEKEEEESTSENIELTVSIHNTCDGGARSYPANPVPETKKDDQSNENDPMITREQNYDWSDMLDMPELNELGPIPCEKETI